MHCEMINIITNKSIASFTSFIYMLRTLKIYHCSKFPVYNTVLTIVTMLYIGCLELNHLD